MIRIGDYFQGFATKKLAAVDVNKMTSNQHEFNGAAGFRALLGTPSGRVHYKAYFAYLTDESEDDVPELFESTLTWYDSRARIPGRSEYRLYYPAAVEAIVQRARVGDTMFLALKHDGSLLLVLAQQGSTVLRQLEWVFDARPEDSGVLFVANDMGAQPDRNEVAGEALLEMLGIEVDSSDDNLMDEVARKFPGEAWPTTPVFAAFARSLVRDCDPLGAPDETLLRWVNMEHKLFRTLEKHRISDKIGNGFMGPDGLVDVDAFLKLSLSVHNRRKSRAGLSLEQHIEALFDVHGIQYVKKTKTEGKKEPDFLFPSKAAYDDAEFPDALLTMLGSKTTLKDRWRQVLNEANRIPHKHLLTLQPGISEDQTSEMQAENLQLVIPSELQTQGFSSAQQSWLLTVDDFIGVIRSKEQRHGTGAADQLWGADIEYGQVEPQKVHGDRDEDVHVQDRS